MNYILNFEEDKIKYGIIPILYGIIVGLFTKISHQNEMYRNTVALYEGLIFAVVFIFKNFFSDFFFYIYREIKLKNYFESSSERNFKTKRYKISKLIVDIFATYGIYVIFKNIQIGQDRTNNMRINLFLISFFSNIVNIFIENPLISLFT